jgi:integrase
MRTKPTKEYPFLELYDKFVAESRSGKRLQPNGKKITPGTLKNYGYTQKLLIKFSADKNFELRVKPGKYLNKRQLIAEKNYWAKFYRKFTDYLYMDCGHFDNYVGQNIKNIRTFFGYLNKNLLLGAGDFHKSFYVRKEEVPIVTLLPEELNFLIHDKVFEESLSPSMCKVKDVFVFGCTVALRVSDLLALKKNNLRIINNVYYLVVRSKKTGTDTQVRLPQYAIDILSKYKNLNGKLLPHFNKVNLNLYVKELAELAGFTQPLGKRREQRGKIKEISKMEETKKDMYRFCDLVTTHTMRRTAITTMLSLGMPETIVRKISGHSPMSKEFFRYVSLAQSYQDTETEQMFEKLVAKKFNPPQILSAGS